MWTVDAAGRRTQERTENDGSKSFIKLRAPVIITPVIITPSVSVLSLLIMLSNRTFS